MTAEEAWARWSRPTRVRAIGVFATAFGLACALPHALRGAIASIESARLCSECICTHATHATAVVFQLVVVVDLFAVAALVAARGLYRERASQAARRFDVVPRALSDHALFVGAAALFVALAGSLTVALLLAGVAVNLRLDAFVAARRRKRFVDAVLVGQEPRWSIDSAFGRRVLFMAEPPPASPYRTPIRRHPVAVL
ncbi:MAG: hypothetical protein KF819_30880 [Labilithrix sp.]|nr:hypothetical protein [Labilithrix sp.]